MKRLGRAETGVSIMLLSLLLVLALLLVAFELWETGCGRAKGLGGPEAPALRRAEAEGEGGGRTTLEVWSWGWPLRRWAAVAEERGEEFESAVLLPSEGSSGICTFRTGRLPPPVSCAELVRDGGLNPSGMEDMEVLRSLLCV